MKKEIIVLLLILVVNYFLYMNKTMDQKLLVILFSSHQDHLFLLLSQIWRMTHQSNFPKLGLKKKLNIQKKYLWHSHSPHFLMTLNIISPTYSHLFLSPFWFLWSFKTLMHLSISYALICISMGKIQPPAEFSSTFICYSLNIL